MNLFDLYISNNELSPNTEILLIDDYGSILARGQCFPLVKRYGVYDVVYFDRERICIRSRSGRVV